MKLSIVTPVYNTRPKYVEEYLESLYNQTFQDFVIIIVNDGSYKYRYPFLENNEKILYIENEKNLGIPKSLNIAYKYVDSEYTVRIDSDDICDKSLLEKEVYFLDKNPEYIAVCCDFIKFGDREGICRRPDEWSIKLAAEGKDFGYAISMMFRSSVLKDITTNESLPICEDFDFHVNLMRFGKIKSLHEGLYFYRKHNEQITRRIPVKERKNYYNKVINNAKRFLENG